MKAIARVAVTIDVDIDQPWSDAVTVATIYAGAAREARETVARCLGSRGIIRCTRVEAVIVPEPDEALQSGPPPAPDAKEGG
jgi:hypothetical protein